MAQEKKKLSSTLKTVIIIIVLTAVIVLGVFFLSNSFKLLNPAQDSPTNAVVESKVQENTSGVSEKNQAFPLSFPQGIKNVAAINGTLYVLNGNQISLYKSSGSYINAFVLNFADPMIKSKGSYLLCYDRQGTGIRIFSGKKLVFGNGFKADGQIITGTVCKNGSFLLVTKSQKSASVVTYYSKSGSIVYQWLCKKDYVVSADVSNNRSKIICAAFSSSKGKAITKVYMLDMNSSKSEKTYTLKDCSPIDAFFVSANRGVVNCSNLRALVDFSEQSKKAETLKLPDSLVMRANNASGASCLITVSQSSSDNYSLAMLDSENSALHQAEIPATVNCVVLQNRNIYYAAEGEICVLRSNGEKKLLAKVQAHKYNLALDSRNVYYYTSSSVFKCE